MRVCTPFVPLSCPPRQLREVLAELPSVAVMQRCINQNRNKEEGDTADICDRVKALGVPLGACARADEGEIVSPRDREESSLEDKDPELSVGPLDKALEERNPVSYRLLRWLLSL